ncbi:M3 family metallopeptidase [Pseudogemmobacter sp. CC-YST710]|uniref:M3 family metallopeptidase n=1 Tax=Pseudogemmobacter faecipullorum TaxID=2755041 RepID=A0ABS8CI22_9RHOB|nr:M3 family metallopeptidase [Pseudogemmobacter faecipullorum]MCB5409036.1 M3 family metallopeptidase [Pseudogemmobacter faecipullorum]
MNLLLEKWEGPFGLPPFAQIRDEDFAPAFDEALTLARGRIAAIGAGEGADFEAVIGALEDAEAELDRIAGLFYGIAGADSNAAREALMRDLAPKLSAFSSEVTNNKALFAKIDALWQRRETEALQSEELRVLELYHRMFLRSGAQLGGEEAARLTAVKSRLASLGTQFSQNLLADERSWFMELTEQDLQGLPDFVVAAARGAGEERGLGPVVTLNRSLIVPFLQFSPRRALRQKAWEAWAARGANGGETDNRGIAAETLALREERAKLLGYADFAQFKLEPEMAKTPQAVRDLLLRVWAPARKKALADQAVLEELLRKDGIEGRFEPWDWRYYSEKRRKAEHDLDEAAIKPYLSLEAMLAAMFGCATRLFGLEFREIEGRFWHQDVRGWEVTRDGRHIAVFLGDYFARGSKRSGAWCTAMRSQKKRGGDIRPIVLNVCNFAKGEPCLLSYDDARTLFHEFGHALHQMLSDVSFGFISGTSVARDFVELPSQLYEHWLEVPEVLERYALHHATGEGMPADLRARLLGAGSYDQGFATIEFIASAMVDLEFHSGPAPQDPMQKQQQVLEALGLPHAIRMRHATPHFAHVFSGDGYSSGYYSYMWSEVMDADAFAAFEETGDVFDPEMARKLEKFILSAGGSEEAETLYRKFRGAMPGVEALLKGRGLLETA